MQIMEMLGELGGHTHEAIQIVEKIDAAIATAKAGADQMDEVLRQRDELLGQVATLTAEKAALQRDIDRLVQDRSQMEQDREAFLSKFRS